MFKVMSCLLTSKFCFPSVRASESFSKSVSPRFVHRFKIVYNPALIVTKRHVPRVYLPSALTRCCSFSTKFIPGTFDGQPLSFTNLTDCLPSPFPSFPYTSSVNEAIRRHSRDAPLFLHRHFNTFLFLIPSAFKGV